MVLINVNSGDYPDQEENDIRVVFDPPIDVSEFPRWKVALVQGTFWYSYPNFSDETTMLNNNFHYSPDGITWKLVVIENQTSSFVDLNLYLKAQIAANGDDAANFSISQNNNTGKLTLTMLGSFEVDFSFNQNTTNLGTMFGYRGANLTGPITGVVEGDTLADIVFGRDAILVNCDLVSGSVLASRQQQVLYAFSPDVPPHAQISVVPSPPIYTDTAGLSEGYLREMRVWLTDNNGNKVDFFGESVQMLIDIAPDPLELVRETRLLKKAMEKLYN